MKRSLHSLYQHLAVVRFNDADVLVRLGRFDAGVSWRYLLMFLGATYLALAVGFPLLPPAEDTTGGVALVLGVLVGGPGLVLLYGGYRLSNTDIRAELFSVVATWCLGGIAVALGILLLAAAVSTLSSPVANALILTALGGVAGYAAGVHNARAKTRELELQETIDRLRTSNERLEHFAYAASHDLQEPLRMVSSYLQLLDDRYRDELDEDAREFIGFAVEGADRMRAMIENLLTYSRITSRSGPLEPTDAEAALETALEDLRRRIEETGASITSDELPTVTADGDQLEQVFQSLLSNALSYSGDAPPRVHVSAERGEACWRFSVADEGIGIDPAYHEQIFEVFEKLQERESNVGSGGIGLAVCERIVERHGGDIWVESAPGDGATFYFTLPAAA